MDNQGRTIIRRNVRDGVAESEEILQPGQVPSSNHILATFFQPSGLDWVNQASREAEQRSREAEQRGREAERRARELERQAEQRQREANQRQREAEQRRREAEQRGREAEQRGRELEYQAERRSREAIQRQREAEQRSRNSATSNHGVVIRANGGTIEVGSVSGVQKTAIRVNGKSYSTIADYEAETGDMSFHNTNISVRVIGAGARVSEWPLGPITNDRKIIAEITTDCGKITVYDNNSLFVKDYVGPPRDEVCADNCSNVAVFLKHLENCGVNVTSVWWM